MTSTPTQLPQRAVRSLQARSRKWRWKFRTTFLKTNFGIEPAVDWWTDRRYGGWLGSVEASRFDAEGSWGYSAVHYRVLDAIFSPANGVTVGPDDVLVDVGCGLGRILNFWLDRRLGGRLYGLEIDEEMAADVARRLAAHERVRIVAGDALANLPADATILFMFNPFKRPVVEALRDRVLEVYGADSTVTIVYYFDLSADVFREDDRFVVEPFRVRTFHSGSVIRLRAGTRAPTSSLEISDGR
jgi:SAM-dependent methyltransferase